LASAAVREQTKARLREQFARLNPCQLKKEVEEELKIIFDHLRRAVS
jgi:hypothetical protein